MLTSSNDVIDADAVTNAVVVVVVVVVVVDALVVVVSLSFSEETLTNSTARPPSALRPNHVTMDCSELHRDGRLKRGIQ